MTADLPSAGRFENGEHLLPVRIYYEDTDFTGIVYHANYLRYMERGRSDYLRLMNEAAGVETGLFAVIRIEIDYVASARIHDALLVRSRYAGLHGVRMRFEQTIERGPDTLVRAVVTAVPINADGRARRPTRTETELWSRYISRTG
ncbi:YbgC/FadM family acyl-CoA thioesterase [bacterium]|nr:YbgC/FadM family acyl-CoA thioesterase [bacterium]